MNKILILIGVVLLLTGVFSCSEESLKSEESVLPFDPDAGEGQLDNDMWAWVVSYPGEVGSVRERLDGVDVLIKGGYVLNTSLNVLAKPKYWQSSGLYIPPAEEIEITVPAGTTNLHYCIGVASIKIPENTANLKRFNNVVANGSLDKDFNVVSNNFGGHLYFYYEGTPTASDITVTVNGAVKSPDFISGQSDLETWTDEVQDTLNPMIWGELIGKNIAITLPIEELRKIGHPEALINEYDGFVENLNKLWGGNFDAIDGIPLWRIYADVQLPEGVVTASGYPIGLDMNKEKILTELINITGLTSAKSKLIINTLGKNILTPWSTSNLLSPLVPQLSTYYLYNLENNWPLDVANLTQKPNIENSTTFLALDEKFRIRMFIQLAQEYGWGLYTYVNKSLNDEFTAPLDGKDKPEMNQQIKNDLFAMAASEYAGENLTDFFNYWHFSLSPYGKNYMKKFDSSLDSIWKDFNRDIPEIDRSLNPIKLERGNPMLIKDTIYNPSEWKALASSEHSASGLAAAAIDGNDGSHWHNNWQGNDTEKSFPHYLHFNFDKEEIPMHQLEFNYIMVRPSSDGRAHMRPKKFIIEALGDDGAWLAVDNGREFYTANIVENQIFYLNKSVTAKGVKMTMINSQNDADDVTVPPNKEGCVLAEFRVGLIK